LGTKLNQKFKLKTTITLPHVMIVSCEKKIIFFLKKLKLKFQGLTRVCTKLNLMKKLSTKSVIIPYFF